jgi:hypothetical protein
MHDLAADTQGTFQYADDDGDMVPLESMMEHDDGILGYLQGEDSE